MNKIEDYSKNKAMEICLGLLYKEPIHRQDYKLELETKLASVQEFDRYLKAHYATQEKYPSLYVMFVTVTSIIMRINKKHDLLSPGRVYALRHNIKKLFWAISLYEYNGNKIPETLKTVLEEFMKWTIVQVVGLNESRLKQVC